MNLIVIAGRLTKDVEMKVTGETKIGNFTLAVNRNYKNKNGGYDTDFFNCKVFNKQAETLQKYCGKGNQLLVNGSVQINNYESDGVKKQYTEVIVNTFDLIGSKNEATSESNPFEEMGRKIEISSDDLPF